MSNFEIAGAYVSVRAELAKGFRADLRDKIRRSVGDGITVPLKAEIKPFRAQLQAEARKSPILIPVKPQVEITKFRAELQKKVAQAAKGVTVRVPVVTTGGVTGGRGTGGTGGGGTGGGGTSRQITDADRIARAENKVLTATNLLNRAKERKIALDEQASRLSTTVQTAEQGIRSLYAQQAAARQANNKALEEEIIKRRIALEQIKAEAVALSSSVGTQQAQSALQNRLNAARERAAAVLSVEVGTLKTREAVQEVNNERIAVEAELRRIRQRSITQNNLAIKSETEGLLRQISAREADIVAQREQLRLGTRRAGQQAQLARGAGATGLSFLGARGATLAAGAPFLIGAAVIATSAKAVQAATALETELNTLRVTSQATAEEMEQVADEARRLGADITLPAVTAQDAAVAMTELAKAGLTVEESMDGARGVLQLATAAQIENAEATELVANALNAFQLRGRDAAHVADLLAGASIAAQGEITDMGTALQQAAAVARQVGISVEDTVAFIALLAKNGLRGSDAGTSLRTAFIRLIRPTKEAQEEIRRLGIDIRDAQGRVRPDVFAQFAEATRDMNAAARDRALAEVFGQDALRAASIFAREGADGLERMREETNRAGAAAELAGARTAGFAGSVENLKNQIQTLGGALGSLTLGPLGVFVDSVASLVETLSLGVGAARDFGEELRDIFEDLGGSEEAGFFKDLGQRVVDLNESFEDAIPGGQRLGDVLGDLGSDAATALFEPGGTWKLFARELRGAADEIDDDATRIEAKVRDLFEEFQRGGGQQSPTALNRFVVQLDELSKKLAQGSPRAQQLARDIDALVRELQSERFIFQLNLDLDESDIRGEANKAKDTFVTNLEKAGPAFAQVGRDWMDILGDAMEAEAPGVGARVGAAVSLSLSTQLAVAQAEGRENAELAILQQQLANARARRARLEKRFRQGRTDLEPRIREEAELETQLQDQIDAILEGRRSEAERRANDRERAARDAQTAQERADNAFLDSLEPRRRKTLNRITIAQASEGLNDDIRANQRLRRDLLRERDLIKERVKTLEIRRDALREVNQAIFEVNQEIKKLEREQAELVRERRQTIREQVRAGIELDIEFAVTTENAALERRSRRRLIASLERERDELLKQKKLTIEQKNRLKEIRNEIAEQRKALQEVTNERRKLFAEMSFAFLTTQQGFFANVASNIFGTGAVAGTVGGTTRPGTGTRAGRPGSSAITNIAGAGGFGGGLGEALILDRIRGRGRRPGDALEERARFAQAEAAGGFTPSQVARLLHLTEQIVRLLGGVESRAKHPENKQSRRRGGAAMDVM